MPRKLKTSSSILPKFLILNRFSESQLLTHGQFAQGLQEVNYSGLAEEEEQEHYQYSSPQVKRKKDFVDYERSGMGKKWRSVRDTGDRVRHEGQKRFGAAGPSGTAARRGPHEDHTSGRGCAPDLDVSPERSWQLGPARGWRKIWGEGLKSYGREELWWNKEIVGAFKLLDELKWPWAELAGSISNLVS
nr:hypothetical protein Iba_chr13eCG5780 [Ipomoea batatas]